MEPAERFIGCLIGTAVGDSLLLPAEGLSRRIVARRFPGLLRQRLVFGQGMVSDDTEHTFLTAQALLAAGDDADRFAQALAQRLRWWLLSLPGGCGKATALGLLRSWLGFPPSRSGVRSAGNGPAMRSAIIGLRWAHDAARRTAFVAASTGITHRDPMALAAAQAVADAAAWIARQEELSTLWSAWRNISADHSWQTVVDRMENAFKNQKTVDDLATDLGCPEYVSGYALYSVPVALFAWLRHRGEAQACLSAILRCGGDTDTIGAIAGALLGVDGGAAAFTSEWKTKIWAWPMSLTVLEETGRNLSTPSQHAASWCWPCQPLRNLAFLIIILVHGFRRLAPF